MAIAKAKLNSLRISPRKARLVVDAIRGNKIEDALAKLDFLSKRAALPVKKLIESAVANAREKGIDTKNLFIEKITVDNGGILYRSMPRARGSSAPIRKRSSVVAVELGEKAVASAKKK